MQIKRELKIGFFIPYFVPAWRFGGPVRGTYEIGKKLAKKGHQVNIYCTDVSNNHKNRIRKKIENIDGINVCYFRNLSNRIASKYKIFLPFELRKHLSNELEKLDIIHLQEIYTIITFWVYNRIKNKRKTFFITTNGVLSPFAQNYFKLFKKILNPFLKKILQGADLVFAQTVREKMDCLKFGLCNVEILNNGIDIQQFQNLPSRSVFRKKYDISESDIIVLFIGRIHQIKGLKYLIEAFSDLKRKMNIKLVIIGPDDNYLNLLLKRIYKLKLNDKIIIIEGLYGQQKIEAYAAADIFCLPSIYDCSPTSLLEACASKLPIITTNTNGLSKIIKEGAGIVVPPCNGEKLRDALLYLINNPDKRKEFGRIGRKKVFKEYNWEKIINSLESYYYKFLESEDN